MALRKLVAWIGGIATMQMPAAARAKSDCGRAYRGGIPRPTVPALLTIAFAAMAMFCWAAVTAAQTGGYGAARPGSATKASGAPIIRPTEILNGIFDAQLNVTTPLAGWEEDYDGCPDGDHGQWYVESPPSYGQLSYGTVTGSPTKGCADPNVYEFIYYKLTQAIPYGSSDPFSAYWESTYVCCEDSSWQAAYSAVSLEHGYYNIPCGGCLPFGGTGYPPSDFLMSPQYVRVGPIDDDDSASPQAAFPSGNNTAVLWQMAGSTVVGQKTIGTMPFPWLIVGQRNFGGDGICDILWLGPGRQLQIWFVNGSQVTSKQAVSMAAPPASSLIGTGALNGSSVNGQQVGDLLWRNDMTGDVTVWLMNGATVTATQSLGIQPLNWSILGDDNLGNVYWLDKTSRQVMIWQVSENPTGAGPVVNKAILGTMPTNAEFAGFGDFMGNGSVDILWYNSQTGAATVWFLQGAAISSTATIGSMPTSWTIAQTGDFEGSGTSDIAWVDNSGDLEVWFMQAGTISSQASIGNIGGSLHVQSLNSE